MMMMAFVVSRFGTIVGKHPCKIIFISIGIALLFGIGMIKFNMDGSPLTLWTPTGSDFKTQQTWVDTRFPSKSRIASIIVEDENVLSKTSFIKVLLFFHFRPIFSKFLLFSYLFSSIAIGTIGHLKVAGLGNVRIGSGFKCALLKSKIKFKKQNSLHDKFHNL